MASHKRASMREGPLAQLFRKTDEDGVDTPAGESSESAEPAGNAPMGAHPAPKGPTPQDRLRAAFSPDIPENVMTPPAARDPYGRVDPTPAPAPVMTGQPILRV